MLPAWKQRLQEEAALLAREGQLKGYKKKRILPGELLTITAGETLFFVPRKATTPHFGERALVLRGPRAGVATPTARVRFPDGTERSVQVQHLRRALPAADPTYLTDARARPAWKRLVHVCLLQLQTPAPETEREQAEYDAGHQDAEQRARQLSGMVAPAGLPRDARTDAARVLLEAAYSEARAQLRAQPGRGGRGQPRQERLPAPTREISVATLDQERRALINNVAKCIHRRYFISDADYHAMSSEQQQERLQRRTALQIIGLAQTEVGAAEVDPGDSRKGSALHGASHDHLLAAYQKALEVCRLLHDGKVELATALADQVQDHRAAHLAAEGELERARRKHHTGRFFHGDILSVRELLGDGTMIQYYTRLTIIYGADGHSVLVANAAELESSTGLKVGPGGWAALSRWIEDQSERMDGRKQGRRQDDDEHLIYRDDGESLVLRGGLSPELVAALDCIARSLNRHDVQRDEIPHGHPRLGVHRTESTRGKD